MVSGTMFAVEQNAFVKTVLSSYNVLVHILMGMVVGIALLFAVKLDYNVTSVPEDIILLHILLCVPGYILLMSQSLLSMTQYNTWSSSLDKNNKRRAHWVLQLIAAGMALSGSITMMIYKEGNFNTTHGQFGLVAFIFTSVNIIVGVAALWSYRLRKFIPPIISKITHILLGIVAYASATACICFAFNKNIFRAWTSDDAAVGVIIITSILALNILANPFVTLCRKIIIISKSRSQKS